MRGHGYSSAKHSFSDCSPNPVGEWRGRLVFKSWGKSVNLHCFFEHLDTGDLHSMSAFRSRDQARTYTAKDGVVDFSEAGIEGRIYHLETGLNRKGNPAWLSAKEIVD